MRIEMKKERLSFIVIAVFVIAAGLGMLVFGQYNTAIQVFDIAFSGNNIETQLSTDSSWLKSDEDFAKYEVLLNEGINWRIKTPHREGFYEAKTVASLYKQTNASDIYYEFYNNGSENTVIILHAYNENLNDAAVFAPFWWEMGFNVIIPQLRAHSENGGLCTFGVYEQYDLLDLIETEGLDAPGKTLVVHGRGIGAASALLLAGNDKFSERASIDFIIADSTYAGLKELELKQLKQQFSLGDFLVGWFLDRIINSNLGFDVKNIDISNAAKHIKIPVMFICPGADGFLDTAMTEKVHESCASEKTFDIIDNAAYAMGYTISKEQDGEYERRICEWLEKLDIKIKSKR